MSWRVFASLFYLVVNAELENAIGIGQFELGAEEALLIVQSASDKWIKSMVVNLDIALVKGHPLASDQLLDLRFKS